MIKATVRRPQSAATLAGVGPASAAVVGGALLPVIDVESHVVDDNSADALANALDAGTPAPGSDEEVEQASGVPTPTAALATRPPATLAQYSESSGGGIEGGFDETDIRLPQLKIVNGSGELAQKYAQGTLLYGDEQIWGPPSLTDASANPRMRFVPIQLKKQWRENLTQEEVEDGAIPRTVDSVAQAEALSGLGATQWKDGKKGKWSPSARCVFLLEAPADTQHPGFCTLLDDKLWALAVYYAGGTSYNETAKAIFNTAQISLKENGRIMLHKKIWNLQIFKKQFAKFGVFMPKIALTKDETGPDVRALALSVTQPGRVITAAE